MTTSCPGDRTLTQLAAIVQPVEARRDLGQLLHRLLESHDAALAHTLGEQLRRVGEGGADIEVGAGVRGADDDSFVEQHFAAQLPARLVGAHPQRHEERPELIGEGDIQQRIDGVEASRCGGLLLV